MQVVVKKCKRCGYEWIPRILGEPVRCARCKTPYWNTDYQRNVKTRR